MIVPSADKSVCLSTGEFYKYYAHIPQYVIKSSNNGKNFSELIDFCMNQRNGNEEYDLTSTHSVQYYSPIPEHKPETDGTMRVTNVVELFERTHNGRNYHFVFGDPIMYNFYNVETREKSKPLILGTNSYCVFSRDFFKRHDLDVIELI